MKEHNYYVYILTNKLNGTLYVGVTKNLQKRVYQHKNKIVEGFSNKYDLNKLVYYTHFNQIESAIEFEKKLKKWKRKWKLELVEKSNPVWKDLFEDL